jgi:hypothetical protein
VASRFASNLTILTVGAFLAAVGFIFTEHTARWLAFSVGAAATVIVAAAFLVRGRGPVQRALDLLTWLTGVWTVVSALTFNAPTVRWLSLGEGGALALGAAIGLIAHEVAMERPFRAIPARSAAWPEGENGLTVTHDGRRAQAPVAPRPH